MKRCDRPETKCRHTLVYYLTKHEAKALLIDAREVHAILSPRIASTGYRTKL